MTSSDLLKALERPIDRFITLDAETYYDKKFSLKKLTTAQYIRDPQFEIIGVGVAENDGPAVWMEKHEFDAYVKTVDWSRTSVLCHNTRFDGFILSEKYGVNPAMWIDTLSMARPLHGAEVGGSLAKLSKHYELGEKGHEVVNALGKRRANFTPEEYERYGAYCRNDVELTYKLFWKMADEVPELELWLIDTTLRFYLEPSFVLDEPLLKAYLQEEIQRKDALLARVTKDKSELMSNDKFAHLLIDRGIDPPRKVSAALVRKKEKLRLAADPDAEAFDTTTWAFAKSDPGMKDLLEHEDDEIRWLAEARVGVKSTINESRTGRFLSLGEGGRPVPVALNYAAAHTFRWGGAEKTNFQNLERTSKDDPKKGTLRKALLAPEGYAFVVADSAQIEARVLAWLAGHTELLETFKRNDATNGDFYSDAGSPLLGKKLSKKETPNERQIAKALILGLGFGMGWLRCSSELLTGMLGTAPVLFTWRDANKYNVDPGRFARTDPALVDKLDKAADKERSILIDRHQRIERMPARIPLNDRIVHCAVTHHLVNKYRTINKPITDFWSNVSDILGSMLGDGGLKFGPNGVLTTVHHGIVLPSGLVMRYPGLKQGDDGFSYFDARKKHHERAYGGSVTENIVQALARIVVAEQMLELRVLAEKLGGKGVTMTHDEVVFCLPSEHAPAFYLTALQVMKTAPEWAPGLPLNAEGGFGTSYGSIK